MRPLNRWRIPRFQTVGLPALDRVIDVADWDEKVKVEIVANQRGGEITLSNLIPEDYHRHREFFLKSYLDKGWTEMKCRSEWAAFQRFLTPRQLT